MSLRATIVCQAITAQQRQQSCLSYVLKAISANLAQVSLRNALLDSIATLDSQLQRSVPLASTVLVAQTLIINACSALIALKSHKSQLLAPTATMALALHKTSILNLAAESAVVVSTLRTIPVNAWTAHPVMFASALLQVQLPQPQIRAATSVQLGTTVLWEVTNLRSVPSVLTRRKKAQHQSAAVCHVSSTTTTTCLARVVARSVDLPLLQMVAQRPALVMV